MDMSYEDFLEHHGIKGQKWGVRRFQNSDGTLTAAGKQRRQTNKDSGGDYISAIHNAKTIKELRDIPEVRHNLDKEGRKELYDKAIAEGGLAQRQYEEAIWDDLDAMFSEADDTNSGDYAKFNELFNNVADVRKAKANGTYDAKTMDLYYEEHNRDAVVSAIEQGNNTKRVKGAASPTVEHWFDDVPEIANADRSFLKAEVDAEAKYQNGLTGGSGPSIGFGEYSRICNNSLDQGMKNAKELLGKYANEKYEQRGDTQHAALFDTDEEEKTLAGAVYEYWWTKTMMEEWRKPGSGRYISDQPDPYAKHDALDEDFLEHHGIKGQKWGVRKYQNDDGSLTPAGRIRYGVGQARDAAVATVKKVASATGTAAKKVAIATGHGVAKVGKATADKVGEVHAKRKAEKREQKIREWSTDLDELKKHQTELTDDEYREALNRANMNRQLSDLKKAELDRGLSYLKSAALATGDTLMLANNVSKMITGKSFEDLRKAPSESDKIKLESERTKLAQEQEKLHQAQVASRNAEAQARDKEDLEQYNKKVREEAYNKTHYQNQMEADKGEREYKAQKKLWDDIDSAMKEVRRTEQTRIREEMNEASIKKDAQYKNGKRLASDNAAQKEAQKLNLNEEQTKLFVENRRHSQGYSSDEKYADKLSSAVRQKQAEDAANAAARDVREQLKNSGLSKKVIERYVEEEKKEAYRRAMAHDAFDDPDYLEHHGIKGQRWGIRRFQNVDGSLTEEGKLHRQNYISKETEKNNSYYAKYEAKYQKLADKAKTDEERAQYLAMKADATKSKNQVNDYLKNMTFDQILSNEKESRDKAIKTATTAAKVGLMGISMAGGVAGIATGVRAGVAGATMAVSFLSNPDNQAKLVNNAMKYAEMGIRTAVDIKQWMVGVTIDEMAQNIGKYTNPDDFRVVGEAAGKVARSMSEGFSSTSGDAVSKATEKIAVSAVSGATKAVEQHGGDTGMAALKIAANLAKETARTSGEISGDVAVTAQNINDVATLITNAGKIKHSDISDDYLEHHGIKGQKWGVRRFQDYDGHRIGAKRKETFGASKTVAYDPKTANTTDHHANDNETQHKARLITKAVSSAGLLAVGVALTATGFLPVHGVMAAGTGALGLGESAAALVKVKLADEKVKKLAAEREANTNVDKRTGLKLKSSEMSEKEDLKRVNPGFNNWNTNTKSNCMLCTTAYDMRRRGFDVQAKTASVGYNYDDVNVWYPKAKVMKIEHKNTILDEMGYTHTLTRDTKKILAAQGDGARGNIMVHWDMDHGGGGHSMVYEVQKGKVIIRCPQSNQTWKDASILNSCMSVSYARLDNVDFDPKKIKEAVE